MWGGLRPRTVPIPTKTKSVLINLTQSTGVRGVLFSFTNRSLGPPAAAGRSRYDDRAAAGVTRKQPKRRCAVYREELNRIRATPTIREVYPARLPSLTALDVLQRQRV